MLGHDLLTVGKGFWRSDREAARLDTRLAVFGELITAGRVGLLDQNFFADRLITAHGAKLV